VNRDATPVPADDPAGRAIATVLRAESAARQDIAQAKQQAEQIVDDARALARALADRNERRIRAVVSAFATELDTRLAEIDAEAERMAMPQTPSTAEIAALRSAVAALARELAGGQP
jgi:vacuolar-type H+-ATPase subunit H